MSISHVSPIRAVPVLRLPDFSTFLWLGVVTARSADRSVLTRGAASYPPGLAALCRVPASIRGLRLARSPLRYRLASPTPRSEPRLLSARTLRGFVPPRLTLSPPLLLPCPSCRICRLCLRPLSVPSLPLSPHAGWAVVLGAAERAGRRYPRFGAVRRTATRQRGGGACRVDRGRGERRPPSAELRSMRDQPPAQARGHPHAHSAPSLFGRLGVVVDHPTSVNPAMTPEGRHFWWGSMLARYADLRG